MGDSEKSGFIKKQEANGILRNLELEIPLGELSLLVDNLN